MSTYTNPGEAWTPYKPQASSSGFPVTVFFYIFFQYTTSNVTKTEKNQSNQLNLPLGIQSKGY